LIQAGMAGATSIADLVSRLAAPRTVCLMVPVAAVDGLLEELLAHLQKGDTVIDGGNSYYHDDIARSKRLAPKGMHYIDMGTSGGVWGLERG
jgi:6-phosphogluconate dehydrogenase